MLVLIGASASGKTEIAKCLIKNHGFTKTITHTTRPKRPQETPGVDYYFLDRKTFLEKAKNGDFLETTEYDHHWYGTAFKDAVFHTVVIVDINGANAIIRAMGDKVFVVFVESPEAVREARMRHRGDHPEAIIKRLHTDNTHFRVDHLTRVDEVILNDEKTLSELASTIAQKYQNKLAF